LIVEQGNVDPDNPPPGALVRLNEIGIIDPELCNYAEIMPAWENLAAGDFVNIFMDGATKKVRRAIAFDTTKPALGFVNVDVLTGAMCLVYYTGPNRNVPTGTFIPTDIAKPVYLSPTVPGGVQLAIPSGVGQLRQFIGYLTTVGPTKSIVITKIISQPSGLPDQSGMAGYVLSTDGTSAFWTPAGAGSDSNYIHDQVAPATIWNVNHNLGKMASVTVVDSAGTCVEGLVEYLDSNTLRITFSAAFSGRAFIN